MTKKMKKQGGFTLVEMLIVVAIIAILIAVSIPLVSTALEKAREATDAANERSFKAELTIAYLSGLKVGADDFVVGNAYVYDAANGSIATTVSDGYGKSTEIEGADDVDREDLVLFGKVSTDGVVEMIWAPKGTATGTDLPTTDTKPLIGSKL